MGGVPFSAVAWGPQQPVQTGTSQAGRAATVGGLGGSLHPEGVALQLSSPPLAGLISTGVPGSPHPLLCRALKPLPGAAGLETLLTSAFPG